jgi:hypothetical protein
MFSAFDIFLAVFFFIIFVEINVKIDYIQNKKPTPVSALKSGFRHRFLKYRFFGLFKILFTYVMLFLSNF